MLLLAPSIRRPSALALALATALVCLPGVQAQRHSGRSAPATAPVPPPATPPVAVSSGLGNIQFVQVNYGVPAPQSLTRQLRFEDDRTRAAALSAIGVPGQYLQHGHIPMPRALDLQLAALGTTDELDALLTVELEQHIVTAVLVPTDGNWRRVATLIYSTPFFDPSTTPSTWVRTARSMIQPDRYRAIFHASSGTLTGNFTENEAQLRIANNKAVITISFESMRHECGPAAPAGTPPAPPKNGCNVVQRWFQPDPADPTHRFVLLTGMGHIIPRDATEPFANSRTMLASHLRNFSCQTFTFSEANQHFEPTAAAEACRLMH